MAIEVETSDACCMRSRRSKMLQRIADTLGTSVDDLSAPPYPYVLHSNGDGTSWVITIGTAGVPVIRHIRDESPSDYILQLTLQDFICNKNNSNPQQKSFMDLIERLIIMHISK